MIEGDIAGVTPPSAGGQEGIEGQQHAAFVLAREIAHLQVSVLRGGLPVHVPRAVGVLVVANGVEVVAAPAQIAFQLAADQREYFVELLGRPSTAG